MEPAFDNLLGVATIAFLAPLLLGLRPSLLLPAVVLELSAGIAFGPDGLGLIEVDGAVEVVSLLGLAFLLFLAGLELDLGALRGELLRLAALSYVMSFALALVVAGLLRVSGLVEAPLLVAVTLSATALGVVVPVLKDSGEIDGRFGQLVVAAASIADVAAVLLLSLLFGGEEGGSTGARFALLGAFVAVCAAVALAIRGAEHSMKLTETLRRLQDTTAQIRVRGAFVLLAGFAALAGEFGLEAILGAFAAGALLSALDGDEAMTHPAFRHKLEAAAFGLFIPVFFVSSGLRFDLDALLESSTAIALVPLLVLALLVVRGLPALILYRRALDPPQARAAGLLQATSLPFIVTATAIGVETGMLTGASGAALVAAGLFSVLLFPLLAAQLLSTRARVE